MTMVMTMRTATMVVMMMRRTACVYGASGGPDRCVWIFWQQEICPARPSKLIHSGRKLRGWSSYDDEKGDDDDNNDDEEEDKDDVNCDENLKKLPGTFLTDYTNKSNLHIAVTDSRGEVVEFDQHGLHRWPLLFKIIVVSKPYYHMMTIDHCQGQRSLVLNQCHQDDDSPYPYHQFMIIIFHYQAQSKLCCWLADFPAVFF